MSKKDFSNPAPVKEPKLTVPQIIEYCKNELGITFNIMDEQKAAEFLHKNNYFFRIKQYTEICTDKTKSGKGITLSVEEIRALKKALNSLDI